MPHYRGRFRKRPYTARQLYRRIRRIKRRRRDPFKTANRRSAKTKRYLKRHSKLSISRPLLSNVVYRKFTQFQLQNKTAPEFVTANGCFAIDYILGYLMPGQDIDFYKARYFFTQLVSLTVTFYIERTVNLTQIQNTEVALTNYTQTQVSDPGIFPDMYVASWNSATEQDAYTINVISSPTTVNTILANKSLGRLTARNKVIRTYHLPEGYRGVWAPTSTMTANTSLDSIFAGPVDNEPHGCTWYWLNPSSYSQSANTQVHLMIRFDAVIGFKSRKLDT